jgi:hypothetical protein
MFHRMDALRFAIALVLAASAAAPAAVLAEDYVPFLPDTTSFVPPFVGQVHHFFSPGQCLEVTEGNLNDEVSFLGSFVQGALANHIITRIEDARVALGPSIPSWHLFAGVAVGWSYPEGLKVTFAVMDTLGLEGYSLYGAGMTFNDAIPAFPDEDPQDTTSVQQVNLFIQFSEDMPKQIQSAGATGMVVESTTDPAARPTGTSIIDIFDVTDKRKDCLGGCLPIDILFRIANTGTEGAVGYGAHITSLISSEEMTAALGHAQGALAAQWTELRQAVAINTGLILSYYTPDPLLLTPCAQGGGLVVFVHNEGTTCDSGPNDNCVIYGNGRTTGLPFPTAIALQSLEARTAPGEIRVSWRSPDGTDNLFFHVYRANASQPDIERRLTAAPIAGGPAFEYVDRDVAPGTEYAYTIGAIDRAGFETRYGPVAAKATARAFHLSLAQNAPNPFNPLTTIRFEVSSAAARTVLRVYDASGRVVRTLVDGFLAPGSYQARWDGRDDAGRETASGMYLYAFDGDRTGAKKMILQK